MMSLSSPPYTPAGVASPSWYGNEAASPSLSGARSPGDLAAEQVTKNVVTIRDGKYRFSEVGNKKERSKPFIYVPAVALERPNFSFDDVFLALGLDIPAIIFRINAAEDTEKWNVRLPAARVKDLREGGEEESRERGVGGDNVASAWGEGQCNSPDPAAQNGPSPARRLSSVSAKFPIYPHTPTHTPSHPLPSSLLQDAASDLESGPLDGTNSSSKINNNNNNHRHAGVVHYQGVLREKCKRLLKGTYSACRQAGAMFRGSEAWSNKYPRDVIAEWLTDDTRDVNVSLLGIADTSSFHEDINRELLKSSSFRPPDLGDDGDGPDDSKYEAVVLPQHIVKRIKDRDIPLVDDPIIPGKRIGSFPHPSITHLIVTDDVSLFEQRLAEIVPWGLMLINGGMPECHMVNDCLQHGRPLVAVKYTGGAADMAIGMLEKRQFWLGARKIDMDIMPTRHQVAYSTVMEEKGHEEPDWLKPFDETHTLMAQEMNVLLENWPDRFNEASVFAVDIFATSEDDVQDRITQTMAVVFEAAYELGGSVSEQKRLTYAWRVRHKFLFNAFLFKLESDLLMFLIILFTMLSTISAVLYTYFGMPAGNALFATEADATLATIILLRANLLLPLLATIVRGIFASVSPMLKYVSLKNAAVQVESELYMYRTKVGKYGTRKRSGAGDDGGSDKRKKGDKGKKGSKGDKDGKGGSGRDNGEGIKATGPNDFHKGPNPRRAFSNALDAIWAELAASDVQNGSLRLPFNPDRSLDDINDRILSNRKEQDSYLSLLAMSKKMEMKGKRGVDEEAVSQRLKKYAKELNAEKEKKEKERKKLEKARHGADETGQGGGEGGAAGGAGVAENGLEGGPASTQEDGWSSTLLWVYDNFQLDVMWSMLQEAKTRLYKIYYGSSIAIEPKKDDGLSSLSADAYVKIRLLPMAAQFAKKAPGLATAVHISAILGVVLAVSSSALSTFDLSVYIPAALAVSGAVTAWTSYQQIDLRLLQTNAALNRLNQLLVWWDGLTMIEKRVPSHKETLVKSTEACVQAQATIFSGSSRKTGDDDDDDDNKNR